MDYSDATYYPMSGDQGSSSYLRPAKAEDWEPYRDIIAELYRTKKLKDVMEEMETVYFFKATPRQYKGKIKQWGLDTKYTKTEEYMEILKTKKEIEEKNKGKSKDKGGGESSSTGSFTVRGKTVSDSSITRFERRAKKRGIIPADDDDEAGASGSGGAGYGDPAVGGSSADYQAGTTDYGAVGPSYDASASGYQGYDTTGYGQSYFPDDYQTGGYSGSGYQDAGPSNQGGSGDQSWGY